MTAADFASYRLQSQQIAKTTMTSPAEVVARLGAMQAQDYNAALWAVALRVPGATSADVEQAIIDRQIIRTWPMRGTLHFVAPQDVRWMLQLLTPRVVAGSTSRQRNLDLDEAVFGHSYEVIAKQLQGGKILTRQAVFEALDTANISTAGQRGYHILWQAAQSGLICLGPVQNKQQTVVLLDEWVPPTPAVSREEALAEITRRYFTSHGPATQHDMMWWSGLTATDVKAGLEMVKSELAQEVVAGKTYWLARDTVVTARTRPAVDLLPGFDEYLLGYRDRDAVLAPQHAQAVCPGNNGMFMPMLVVDGQIVGTWKRTLKKTTVQIELRPFAPLSAATRAAAALAADRYATHLGLTAVIQ
jgi:hypothetical protein